MKKLYKKYKELALQLDNDIVGVVCGYTNSHFLLSVDDLSIVASFTLEELAHQDYFIEKMYLQDCELALFMYIDENQIIKCLNKKN